VVVMTMRTVPEGEGGGDDLKMIEMIEIGS